MFKKLALTLLLFAGVGRAAVSSVTLPLNWTTADGISRSNLNLNPIALRDGLNVVIDSLNPVLAAMSGFSTTLLLASAQDLVLKVDSDNNGTNRFYVLNGNVDTLFRVNEDSTAKLFGPVTLGSTATTTGKHTFTAAPRFSSVTASEFLLVDGSKDLTSVAGTGTGNVMRAASPTTTGTLTGAAANFSGSVSTGALTATTGSFSSTLGVTGTLTGAAANFSGAVSTAALTGTTGSFTSTLGVSGVATINNTLTVNSDGGTPGSWGISAITSSSGNGTQSLDNIRDHASNIFRIRMRTAGTPVIALSIDGGGNATFPISLNSTGPGAFGSTLGVTGVATFASAPVFNSVTASQFLLVDGSKALTSVAATGSGSVVRATSPTIATPTFSGTIASGLTASRTVVTDGSGNLAVSTETGTGAHMRAASPTTTGTLTADAITASGVTTASGGLTLGAGFVDKTTTVTSGSTTLTAAHSVIFADASGGTVTLNLPAVSGTSGRVYTIYKVDASPGFPALSNPVVIDPDGSELVDGVSTLTLLSNWGSGRVTLISNGTYWFALGLYDEGEFTGTLTGCTTSPTGLYKYVRNGWNVTITTETDFATSNATTFTITGMPAALRPTATRAATYDGIVDNGNTYTGYVSISTAGVISPAFRSSLTAAPSTTFTNSGNKGIVTNNFTYNQ